MTFWHRLAEGRAHLARQALDAASEWETMRGVLPGLRLASCLTMRAFLILACVLLLPRPVFAQTASLPITIGGGVLVNGVTRVGPAQCNSSLTIQWGIPTAAVIPGQVCSPPQFWITSGTCPSDASGPAIGDLVLRPAFSSTDRSGTFSPVAVSDLPLQTADGGGGCGNLPANVTLYVCATVKYNVTSFGCGTNDAILHATNAPTIQYRGAAPSTPSLDGVTPQDGAVVVNVTASSDANLIHVEMRPLGQGDFAEVATFTPDKSSTKVSGLTNGTTYEVRVFVDDGVGNNSPYSATLTATPVASDGLLQTYRRDGGTETGGCGSALPAGLGIPLVLGGYRWLRRRRT